MKTEIAKSVSVALVLALGTISLWKAIDDAAEQQVARIAEAESYAARAQLVRNIDSVLAALRNLRTYWFAFGHTPPGQWASDAGIELEHFAGIEMIFWDDPARDVRYARTPEQPVFDYRPSDEEWASYRDLLDAARSVERSEIVGPVRLADGKYRMTVIVAGSAGTSGRLAAVVNIDNMLDLFLQNESPGFAVQVYAGDQMIYERGSADPNAPDEWVRGGLIRSSFGTLWRVVHLPTSQMLESYSSAATDLTLLLGLIVSILMGTLTFENGRARSRAHAAELAEARVSDMNRNLETLVEDRTRELSARTADLQTLTDSVAHDLRNPLNVLAVNIELLEDIDDSSVDRAQRMEIMKRMSPCIDQMADVLDRLLGLSTLANSTFEREHIDMSELVHAIYEDLVATELSSSVEFTVGGLPDAEADRTLIQVLLMNLLGNALKYTRGRERRIIIVDHESRDGEIVYFVRDNGKGFDARQAEKIFNAFTRLDENGDTEGIGLGLTLAKKVIARHGGRIWAESEPGRGATFYFVLSPEREAG